MRTGSILGLGIGVIVGFGIGFCVTEATGNNLYDMLFGIIGIILGQAYGPLLFSKPAVEKVEKAEDIVILISGILGVIMGIVSLIAFLKTEEVIGIVGAVFLGGGGIYLLKHRKEL